MRISRALLSVALVASGCDAASSACTGQQYNNLPGFPAYNSGCPPTTYYQTYDLGNTNPSDAVSRCQQACTSAGATCGSIVIQVNKAADSNLYSGTCFLFHPGQTPSGPRQCANTVYLLDGYSKDDTLACFSSSSVAATRYCSSLLGIPLVTRTATAAGTTRTSTITLSSTLSTTTTSTFVTTTSPAPAKRAVKAGKAADVAPKPACATAGTSRLSAACSCLSIKASTTIITTTPTPVIVTSSTTMTQLAIETCVRGPNGPNLIGNPNFDTGTASDQSDTPWSSTGQAFFQNDPNKAQTLQTFVVFNPGQGLDGSTAELSGSVSQPIIGLNPSSTYQISYYLNFYSFQEAAQSGYPPTRASCVFQVTVGSTLVQSLTINDASAAAFTGQYAQHTTPDFSVSGTSEPLQFSISCQPVGAMHSFNVELFLDTTSLFSVVTCA